MVRGRCGREKRGKIGEDEGVICKARVRGEVVKVGSGRRIVKVLIREIGGREAITGHGGKGNGGRRGRRWREEGKGVKGERGKGGLRLP